MLTDKAKAYVNGLVKLRFTGKAKDDVKRSAALVEHKTKLGLAYEPLKVKCAQTRASILTGQDYRASGKNESERDAWLELQLQADEDHKELQTLKLYWSVILNVERHNDTVMAYLGLATQDKKRRAQ